MSDKKDTSIHRPDGVFTEGDKVGHADDRSHIRRRDGIIFKGDEIGYVDKKRRIRKPDGIIFKGDVVGQVKKDKAHAEDGIVFSGEEWGYVDDEGNIRQRDGVIFKGRVIGKMRGHNKAAALGFFVLKFARLEERYSELERAVRSSQNPVGFLGKVRHMIDFLPKAEALGDFDGLTGKLRLLESEVLDRQARHRSSKEELCRRAESLANSTDWKATADSLQAMQKEWKDVGSAGADEERLWQRFRTAQDRFFERRKEHFEKQERQREHNRARKESLCSRAESLSNSSDWRNTAEELKVLQAQWKEAGYAGRDHDQRLWDRFRYALDRFFERQNAHFEHRRREEQGNLHRKQALCEEAESLAHAHDYRSATQRVKELQQEWKNIGHVPREDSESLWKRFQHSCDAVFDHARREYEHKQENWRDKMREALARKREQADRLRESIAHDEGNIERWQNVIDNLHPGGRADEIQADLESRIADVEDRIRSKRAHVEELEESISDIESKLNH